jgi:hypothetical protein
MPKGEYIWDESPSSTCPSSTFLLTIWSLVGQHRPASPPLRRPAVLLTTVFYGPSLVVVVVSTFSAASVGYWKKLKTERIEKTRSLHRPPPHLVIALIAPLSSPSSFLMSSIPSPRPIHPSWPRQIWTRQIPAGVSYITDTGRWCPKRPGYSEQIPVVVDLQCRPKGGRWDKRNRFIRQEKFNK